MIAPNFHLVELLQKNAGCKAGSMRQFGEYEHMRNLQRRWLELPKTKQLQAKIGHAPLSLLQLGGS